MGSNSTNPPRAALCHNKKFELTNCLVCSMCVFFQKKSVGNSTAPQRASLQSGALGGSGVLSFYMKSRK